MKKSFNFVCSFLLFFLPAVVFASDYSEFDRAIAKDPKVNVKINVPGLFVGIVEAKADFKVSDKITLGPTLGYLGYGKYDTGYILGVSMNYALSKEVFADRAWLFNPYITYYHTNSNVIGNFDKRNRNSATIAGANLIYQWMWDSGFNVQLGGGLYYSNAEPPLSIGKSHVGGLASLKLGYAF